MLKKFSLGSHCHKDSDPLACFPVTTFKLSFSPPLPSPHYQMLLGLEVILAIRSHIKDLSRKGLE